MRASRCWHRGDHGGLRGTALDADVTAQLFARTRHHSRLERLSPRERDALEQLAQGPSNAGAAEALCLGEGAVQRHITNVFTKLDLDPSEGRRRAQAVLAYLGER